MPFPLTKPRAAALLALAAATAGGVWYGWPGVEPPDPAEAVPVAFTPDPRLTIPTPYQNVHPSVKYVGDAACAACHPDIDHAYHQHPMGRSAARVGSSPVVERFDAAANNPATSQGFELKAVPAGGQVKHVVTAKGHPTSPAYTTPADVAIGSGVRGRSYLSVEAGGAVWESPVSWFGHTGKWDVSPGFELPGGMRREVGADCLFCHVDRVEPVLHSANRFREPLFTGQAAIGCERCHGPGQLHVAEREANNPAARPDTTIVNPKHLAPDLRLAICQQCHLQGVARVLRPDREWFDYRPGLPLEPFFTVFVRHPDLADAHRSVGQVEQMAISKCYTGSAGRLDCTSCHDPHEKPDPADAAKVYRDRCLACHADKGCSAPAPARQARADSCIACHMPKAASTNIAHTAVTDHRVLRLPAAKSAGSNARPADPVIPFLAGPRAPPPADRDRDLGVALSMLVRQPPPDLLPFRAAFGRRADRHLTAAVAARPGDPAALYHLALTKSGSGGPPGEAVAAAEAAVAAAPDSEPALTALVDVTAAARDFPAAARAAGRVIEMNPTAARPWLVRAFCRMLVPDWPGAEADCRAAIAIQPLDPGAWEGLGQCRQAQGDVAGRRAAYATAAGLVTDPKHKARLLRP